VRRALRNAALVCVAVTLPASLMVGGAFGSAAAAQESAAQEAVPLDEGPFQQVHVEARRLEDGRTEFALRPHDPDGFWDDPILPDRRFFPVDAPTDRWLVSRPITLRLAPEQPGQPEARVWVRITARHLADGRIDFGVQRRSEGGRWSERLLPARRFFPTTAGVGRWLVSSPVTVAAPPFEAFAAGGGGRSGETLLAASFDRTCAVRPDGGLSCWGREGTRERLSAAVLEDVLAVSIGVSPTPSVPRSWRASAMPSPSRWGTAASAPCTGTAACRAGASTTPRASRTTGRRSLGPLPPASGESPGLSR